MIQGSVQNQQMDVPQGKAFRYSALLAVSVFAFVAVVYQTFLTKPRRGPASQVGINKEELAEAIARAGVFPALPTEVQVPFQGQQTQAVIQYSFDPKLQEKMENLYQTYDPDYGAFVAMDAKTGRILSLVSYSRRKGTEFNMALRATFPSASVFKVVTAAAAIAEKNFSADTVIPFTGGNHTLYRSNILKTNLTRWVRYMTLKEAFAKSVNTVFGKIGAYTVGADDLREYALKFGFNRRIGMDLPVEESRAIISEDPWELAETASGFTQSNTMSAIQGALIAAAVANDGKLMEPYAVQSVYGMDGASLYSAVPAETGVVVDPKTASELRDLMKQTVKRGTSSRSFRGFFRGDFSQVDVGGKTGSLTGNDPQGKYDWFVGFAGDEQHRIAFAALTVHEKYWKVKSAYLARKAIETYFNESVKE